MIDIIVCMRAAAWADTAMHAQLKIRFNILSFRFFSFVSRALTQHTHAHTRPNALLCFIFLLNFLSRRSLILRYYYYSRRSFVDVELILFLFRFVFRLSFQPFAVDFCSFIFLFVHFAHISSFPAERRARTHTHTRQQTAGRTIARLLAVGTETQSKNNSKECIHKNEKWKWTAQEWKRPNCCNLATNGMRSKRDHTIPSAAFK